jgi:hypothetical protein
MRLILWLSLIPVLLCKAFAQDVPVHRFRILAVGDSPPFVQEVRDGARYEVAPPKGSLPPRELKVPSFTKSNPPKDEAVRIRLGRMSDEFAIPAVEGQKPIELKTSEGGKWLQLSPRPGGVSLALAWRGGRDWTQAAQLEIPQERLDRMAATVHIANVTQVPVAVIIGTERIRLNPRKSFTRVLKVGSTPLPIEVLSTDFKGRISSILASTIEPITPGFRVIAIYQADGVKPRTPVKVVQIEEPF